MLYFSSKNNTYGNLRQDIATNCVDRPILQNSPILQFSNEPQHFLHNAKLSYAALITKYVRKLWQNWAEHCRIKETTSTAVTHKSCARYPTVWPCLSWEARWHEVSHWRVVIYNFLKRLNKGRTIRKLMGGGGRSTKKIFAQGKIEWKKIHAHQLTLKNIHATA